MVKITKEAALEYHEAGRPGKIEVKFRRIDNRKVFEGSEIKKVWRIAL
mgnify:CR=1 FL=1